MHPNTLYSAASAIGAIRGGLRVQVVRNLRVYGLGTNPGGGRYIAVEYGPAERDVDRIYERAVDGSGPVPVDGGSSSRWRRLTDALGMSPWDATDEQIVAAWASTVDAVAAALSA